MKDKDKYEAIGKMLFALAIALLLTIGIIVLKGIKREEKLTNAITSAKTNDTDTEVKYQRSDISQTDIRVYRLTSSEDSEYMLGFKFGTLIPLGKELPEYLILSKRLTDTRAKISGLGCSRYIMLVGDKVYTLVSVFDNNAGYSSSQYKQIEAFEITDEAEKEDIKSELLSNTDGLVKLKLSEIVEEKTLIE